MIKKIMLLILSITLIMGLSACTVNINLDGSESSKEETVDEEVASKIEDSSENLEEDDTIEGSLEEQEVSKKQEVSGVISEPAPEKQEENITNLTLEDAKGIFSENYPEVAIEIAKTEGKAYYIQGFQGGDICKMKIIASTGEIVLNKRITTERNVGYNK